MKKIDLAIIGSGPAGYSAAIYASRALLKPHLFTGTEVGGQLMYTTEVENYPGFSEGIMGPQLMQNFADQAQKFGTKMVFESVSAVDFSQKPFKIWINFPSQEIREKFEDSSFGEYAKMSDQIRKTDPSFAAKAVIITTGARAIILNLKGEKRLMGRGISTCAVCDAAFFKGKKVFVVGGGDSAMEDALALARFTDQVTIIHRRDSFRASKIMQQRVFDNKKIQVLWDCEVTGVKGEQKLEQIEVKIKDQIQNLPADGLFLAIGHKPVTHIFQNEISLDNRGYIITSQSNSSHGLKLAGERTNKKGLVELPTMTSVEGVFAAGDVVDLRYKQAITAAGMGVAAALDAETWLNE